ncbi:MAG: DegV family protein [Candidatus Promineifilaceae bacterium]
MRVVMDDAGDVPAELIEKYNIAVIPVNITFGTEEFLSGINMSHQEFYEKVKEVGDHNFPKTAQPTPYQFTEFYRNILDEGEDEILTVTVGGKLSGTYASAEASRQELEGQGTFHLFDSMGGSAAQGYMAIEAARMAAEGVGAEAILDRLKTMRDQMVVVFLIDSLDYAVRGGRVSSLQSTVASLLKIKPIMKLEDGLIVEAGKVRTYKKALEYIVEYVHERVGDRSIELAFIHANDPDGVIELQKRTMPKLNASETMTTEMGLPVSINLGPGALGIVAIPV